MNVWILIILRANRGLVENYAIVKTWSKNKKGCKKTQESLDLKIKKEDIGLNWNTRALTERSWVRFPLVTPGRQGDKEKVCECKCVRENGSTLSPYTLPKQI